MPLINPFRQQRCPFCFQSFRLWKAHLTYPAPKGIERLLRTFYIVDLNQRYANENTTWVCPHCKDVLPPNIIGTPNYVLGIIGGRTAGKSHYIASLINALKSDPPPQRLGISGAIAATGAVAERYETEYCKPFFTERTPLDVTLPIALLDHPPKPLIYTLKLTDKKKSSQRNRLNLVCFDYSGEDYAHEQAIIQHMPFMRYINGIILLVDPLEVAGMKRHLPLHMQQEHRTGEEAAVVLENIIRVLKKRQPRLVCNDLLDVPLVIAVTKSDLLKYVLPNLGQHPLRYDADYRAGFNQQAFYAHSNEVLQFCRKVGEERLIMLAQAFRQHAFCTVSATGRAVDRDGHFGSALLPLYSQRCLDPLLWLLSKR